MTPNPTDLTLEDLIDGVQPLDINISPSGEQVVYQLKANTKKGDNWTSSLWLAEVGKEKSARQLTSGQFEDKSPRWSPDSSSIAFISDRKEAGKSSAIYILPISAHGGEAYPVTDVEKKRGISELKWSPDGNSIAYLSADEKTPEEEKKEKDKDDVKVFGEDWQLNKLRLLHVATREVTVPVNSSKHVLRFVWRENSKEVLYGSTATSELESPIRYGVEFSIVTVQDRKSINVSDHAGQFSDLVWNGDDVYFIANVRPSSSCSSSSLWKLSLKDRKCSRHAFGETSCATGMKTSSAGKAYILVQNGLDDEIHILDGSCVYKRTGFISDWSIAETARGTHLAITVSTPSNPLEVHTTVLEDSNSSAELTQVSSHNSKIASMNLGSAQVIKTRTSDDKAPLEFVYFTPQAQMETTKPLPTVVQVHGGPYHRSTVDFANGALHWQPMLLSTGKYGVLTANYRGGSGYGDEYAGAAGNGVGTLDYADVIACVDEGIKRGLVDPQRILVAGWSQGGFMSYICAARNGSHKGGWRFKGAIPGAGISDADMMSNTSDTWCFQAELAGGAPWEHSKKNIEGRKGSAVWEISETYQDCPPCLVLHGEADERVPVTQAWAWKRACLKYDIPCEMCVYPREPHGVKERAHVLDILKRVRRFVDSCIG